MRFSAVLLLASCIHATPAQHVEILPAPSSSTSEPPITQPESEDSECKPRALPAIAAGASGVLDPGQLRDAISAALRFAERCCSGDESGIATVRVTVSPEGYATGVDIEPERLRSGPTGACLYASFHRVTTGAFQGSAVTITLPVHVR